MKTFKCIDPGQNKGVILGKTYFEFNNSNLGSNFISIINEKGKRVSYYRYRFIEVKPSKIYELW